MNELSGTTIAYTPASHDSAVGKPETGPHTGVLLVNLGTPDSTKVSDVRKYLRQFLMDGRVLDIPALPRWLLVNGIIAPFRSPKSAKGYRQLWLTEDRGSPLKYYGQRLEALVQAQLGPEFMVRLAMRYQSPSIEAGLEQMHKAPLDRIIVLPLFPQYASASTGSVVEAVMEAVKSWQTMPEVQFVQRFHDREDFIEAFAAIARPHLEGHDYDHLLFSYHGLPERQIMKGDTQGVCVLGSCCDSYGPANQWCYRAQCFDNSRRLAAVLGWPEDRYSTSFQSRLGRTPWIKPYTDDHIRRMREQGIKRVAVISPSFIADCLETTLEIGDEYKELFEELGGEHWQLIPSLNESPLWIDTVCRMVRERMPAHTQQKSHQLV